MRTAFYIVLEAQGRWWIDLEGKSTGPFTAKDVAVAAAVSMAESTARNGGRSEVRLAGPGYDNRMVYQSAAQSALARAARKPALVTA
jgi:hypothetical protein